MHSLVDIPIKGQSLQNETQCVVVSPAEGLIVIEVTTFPRLLPFVVWRKYSNIEIRTKVSISYLFGTIGHNGVYS